MNGKSLNAGPGYYAWMARGLRWRRTCAMPKRCLRRRTPTVALWRAPKLPRIKRASPTSLTPTQMPMGRQTGQLQVHVVGAFSIATSFTYKQIRRGFLDDSDCREYYEDAWIFGEEAIAAAEAAEAAAEAATDPASGNGTEEAGVSDPNGTVLTIYNVLMRNASKFP